MYITFGLRLMFHSGLCVFHESMAIREIKNHENLIQHVWERGPHTRPQIHLIFGRYFISRKQAKIGFTKFCSFYLYGITLQIWICVTSTILSPLSVLCALGITFLSPVPQPSRCEERPGKPGLQGREV